MKYTAFEDFIETYYDKPEIKCTLQKFDYRNRSGKMTMCDARNDYGKQELCKGFRKATHDHRCMYLIFNEYCQALKGRFE